MWTASSGPLSHFGAAEMLCGSLGKGEALLKRSLDGPTAAVLDALTEAEVQKIVLAPLALPGAEHLHTTDQARKNVALQKCACCMKKETALATFSKCSKCKCTYYCGAECQRQDWKGHKRLCPQLAA